MFHSYLDARQYGVWEDRTVWIFLSPMRMSMWNKFIQSIVPAGFYSDFASVPRHFHMYDLFGGRCNAPAGGHDLFYRKDAEVYVDLNKWPTDVDFPEEAEAWLKSLPKSGLYPGFPKELADFMFRQLMIEDGEPLKVYEPMYLAVKKAGSGSFHRFNVGDVLPCERVYKIEER